MLKRVQKWCKALLPTLDYFSKCIMTDCGYKKRGEIQCNTNAMLMCPHSKYAVCRLTIAPVQYE